MTITGEVAIKERLRFGGIKRQRLTRDDFASRTSSAAGNNRAKLPAAVPNPNLCRCLMASNCACTMTEFRQKLIELVVTSGDHKLTAAADVPVSEPPSDGPPLFF